MQVETDIASLRRYAEGALWIFAILVGPVPWVMITTVGLEHIWGLGGYSVGFLGAPALWMALSVGALLWARRRWTIVAAAVGLGLRIFVIS